MINGKVFFFWFQMRVLLIKDHLTKPLSKERTSLFPATQLAIQLRTLHGRKLAVQGCCIKERRTVFITYKERLLEIMRVQLGMELEKNLMLLPQSLYTVSGFLQFLFICSLRKWNSIPTGCCGCFGDDILLTRLPTPLLWSNVILKLILFYLIDTSF